MTFEEVLQRFQEPTLGSILRENSIAKATARKAAAKEARAADDALAPFITTSSSPQSTSRHHSPSANGNRSRPASAATTMTKQQIASELYAESGNRPSRAQYSDMLLTQQLH